MATPKLNSDSAKVKLSPTQRSLLRAISKAKMDDESRALHREWYYVKAAMWPAHVGDPLFDAGLIEFQYSYLYDADYVMLTPAGRTALSARLSDESEAGNG